MFQFFFYFAEILKMTELRPNNRFFGPEIPKDSKKAKTEEDSYSGICQQKLLTKAMFKPLGYDVHNVHISVYIGDWVCILLDRFRPKNVRCTQIPVTNFSLTHS